MVLSGDGALAAKVVADSHSVVDLHGAGCWDCRCVVVVAEVERDLPIRVLEFIDMVVPHRFVKGIDLFTARF